MSNLITDDKEILKEIINRLDDSQHDIVLHDLATDEVIYINDTLLKIIKMYFQDKLQSVEIKAVHLNKNEEIKV